MSHFCLAHHCPVCPRMVRYAGRLDLRTEHFETNCSRCVRPERATIKTELGSAGLGTGSGQQQVRNVYASLGAFKVNLVLYSVVEVWAWARDEEALVDRSQGPTKPSSTGLPVIASAMKSRERYSSLSGS